MKVEIIYFSPTGTTKKVLEGIVEGIAPQSANFTDLQTSQNNLNLDKQNTDLAIIAAPTYASRIPPEAAIKLQKLKSNGIPVVLVTLYGNNKFGDALLEMKNIANSAGFIPIAAAAFIGEHSFSTKAMPIAINRPDMEDLQKAKSFGILIKKQLSKLNLIDISQTDLQIPGNFPYRQWNKLAAKPPITDEKLCIKCRNCEDACPVNAIMINEKVITNPDLCIFCCACVKVCPVPTRTVTDLKLLEIAERLYNTCSDRQEPEIFI